MQTVEEAHLTFVYVEGEKRLLSTTQPETKWGLEHMCRISGQQS